MGEGVALLISELVKLGLQRVNSAGKYNTLTEEEAKAIALEIGKGLSTHLPTPEELESGSQG